MAGVCSRPRNSGFEGILKVCCTDLYTDIVLVSAKSATSIDAIQTAQHYIVHLASSLVANSVSCHVTRWLGQSPEEHEFPRRSAAFHQRAHPFER